MRGIRRGLVLLAVAIASAPANAVIIEFQPAADTVTAGETFGIDVLVSGLTAAGETITAFDLFFGFDPAVIDPLSVAMGPAADAIFDADVDFALADTFDLGFAILGVTGLSSSASFSISAASFPPVLPGGQGDSVLLATLTFEALSAGFTELGLVDHPLLGIPADVVGIDLFSVLAFDSLGTAAITVEPAVSVPEPPVLSLLGIALFFSWTLKRPGRRR